MGNVNKIIVHSGMFHPDDVYTVAIIQQLNPELEVVRLSNNELRIHHRFLPRLLSLI